MDGSESGLVQNNYVTGSTTAVQRRPAFYPSSIFLSQEPGLKFLFGIEFYFTVKIGSLLVLVEASYENQDKNCSIQ